jgi:cytosine/adenosine deaminase-related metal-dependent hydrolase
MAGARCAGLDDKVGSLAPGKDADLLMIRSDDINLYPSNNALGTVVQAAESSNIDTVIIGGRVRVSESGGGPRHAPPQNDGRGIAVASVRGCRLSPRR